MTPDNWVSKFTSLKTESQFEELALEAFIHQYKNIGVYKYFVDLLGISPKNVGSISKIPFLPISAFKNHRVTYNKVLGATLFSSSGTTGAINSLHYVSDTNVYTQSFLRGFERFYGPPANYVILALLPSYLERADSSLVYMVRGLMEQSKHHRNGFYLYNYAELNATLEQLKTEKRKVLLIGVTFALLDFAEKFPMPLPNVIIMETGGMKGRRREMTRVELHNYLTSAFGCEVIHSEYGMTELLSQAYSKGQGIFELPPWMRVLIRDPYDPKTMLPCKKVGGLNIIDLANINSCCFIETQDLGILHNPEQFEVIGRFDNADIRGCNLMVQ
jgi:hypothetical protein